MTKNNSKNNQPLAPIAPRLRLMEVGDTIKFPTSRLSTVKVSCNTISLQLGVTFKTSVRRQENIIEVTRVN